ncbi:MAG: FHA domain-containing protein [Armatimonadetes bacterium]|nr:FHA domain-containing protein [Armatimonadota bacterium]
MSESGLVGLIFGAIGSTIGANLGSVATAVIMHPPVGGVHHMDFAPRVIARALQLMPIGLCMGVAIGLTLKSKRGLIAGLLGGLIGGLFVGFGFDLLGVLITPASSAIASGVPVPAGMTLETGGPSRALMAVGLGVAVGLFVAIMDRVTRKAWVRLVLGRNEGKEWPIDAERTMIGRDERAHVPLFGDMNVEPLHAIIHRSRGQYVLQDQGTQIGVGWNNQRVSEVVLSPGDSFQIGSHNLQFLMKEGAAQKMGEGRATAQPINQGGPVQQQPIQQPGQQIPQPTPQQPVQQPTDQQSVAMQPQAQQQAATLALVVTSGPMTGQRFELTGPIEAGREAPGITLGFDPQASRRHASFTPMGDTIAVQDLGSTNGTFVNGKRIQSATLNRGDVVQIGNSTFRVE